MTIPPVAKSVPSSSASPLPVQPLIVASTSASDLSSPSVFYETKMVTVEESEPHNFVGAIGTAPTVSGTYVIYSNDGKSLKYASSDGKTQGVLFDFSDTFPPSIIHSYVYPFLTHSDIYPRSVHFQAEQPSSFALSALSNGSGADMHTLIYDEDAYNVLVTDIIGNPLNSWVLTPTHLCFAPYFSPQGNWIAIECQETKTGNSYLNLISLGSGNKTKAYHLPNCGRNVVSPPMITWSSDDKHLLYSCPAYSLNEFHCFFSIDDDEMVCKTISLSEEKGENSMANILSVSPDWSKIVFDLGYQKENENGLISGYRVYLTDIECIVTEEFCDQGSVLDLPLAFPCDPNNQESRPAMHLFWNTTKNKLVWVTSSNGGSNDMSLNSHIVGSFDLFTGKTYVFEHKWYRHTQFISISPDGNWLLYYALEPTGDRERELGYHAISLMNGDAHPIAPASSMSGNMEFYGWLATP